MPEALKKADEVLQQAVQGITDLINLPALINLDFADVQTVMTDKGIAHIGIGTARGDDKALEAVKQAIFKIIMTERYQYIMYSWNYGIELLDLFGEPVTYVCPELKRRISEALLCDDRIWSVDNFEFDFPQKGVVHVVFTTHTIFGDVQAEREVNF